MSLVREWVQRLRWLGRSSTLRLAGVLSAIFAVGFMITVFVALFLGQRAIEARTDANLAALAQSAPIAQAQSEGVAMILRPMTQLEGLPQPFQRAAARGGATIALRDNFLRSDVWRVLVARDSDGVAVMVAVPLEESAEAQELLAGILWSTAIVVVVIALAIGLWAGFLAQRRLGRINTTLEKLAAGDLSSRVGLARSKDDLDDIAHKLDQTAAELERLVAQTRNLSASIAHDLRTPLARLRAGLEMLPEGAARSDALEEAGHLAEIFDTIMRVARIEAGQGSAGFEPVNLGELAQDLAETFGPVVEDEGKLLTLELADAASVHADRAMLVQAMANLIQNAMVHGGSSIVIFADGATIGVQDDGPGVAPEQYDEILKPMVRLDAARSTPGSGLGLALVRAVADRHKAGLRLGKVAPHGLKISLKFTKM